MKPSPRFIALGHTPLTIEDVVDLAHGRAQAQLDADPSTVARRETSAAFLAEQLATGAAVYGVSTGVGDSVTTRVAAADFTNLSTNIMRFHGCGVGAPLTETQSAAVLAVRVASLARGYGGARPVVIQRLVDLLNLRILPCIPSIGSVGASGDLTPLSYVAAVLAGERTVSVAGEVVPSSVALARAQLAPLQLAPKESLTVMNGTSVTTALACLAFDRARWLTRWVASLTAMASDVLQGNPAHFDARLFELKPHPGLCEVAGWIRTDIEYDPDQPWPGARLQDRYCIRCAPHVLGVLRDGLNWMRPWLEVEIHSVNDNPILHMETRTVLHGGNFYGGHLGFAMDSLKGAIASVADLLDRQMALLCDEHANHGLPANLRGGAGDGESARHGFKAMAILTSALAAEACKATMPASAFSRSTENHNQDKVPMATLAARDCLQILELTETAAAVLTLALCQAADLRAGAGCHARTLIVHAQVRQLIAPVGEDRQMDGDIATILELARAQTLAIGEEPR